MKKTFLVLLTLFLLPTRSFAMVDSDVWSYVFHLEYKNGILQTEEGMKYPYSPVPVEYIPEYKSNETDFYGIVYNMKNTEEARFGFMAPSTTVVSLGKSVFDVLAPKFADAERVAFYSKAGKLLFAVSVKDSSFCDDNLRCDSAVGESYLNCPHDCPAPVSPVTPPTPPVISPPLSPETPPIVVAPSPSTAAATSADTTYVTTSTNPTSPQKSGFDVKTILSFVGGILLITLALVVYRIKKSSE